MGSGLAAPPLSYAQRRLWFLDQMFPGLPAYNVTMVLRLRGELLVEALGAALNDSVVRHEILRTTFPAARGRPFQLVAPTAEFRVAFTDMVDGDEARAMAHAVEQAQLPFDLAAGPLLRAELVRLCPHCHLLVLSLHHIICDGWSFGVLFHELAEHYTARVQGRTAPLPPLPLQYGDYAFQQHKRLAGERLAELVAWWRAHLEGAPPLLDLPLDHPRPAERTFTAASHSFPIPQPVWHQVLATARRNRATPFVVLLAAYAELLSRVTDQTEVVVASPVAGRDRTELEPLIGFFVNTLPLRLSLAGWPTFTELVQRVRAVTLDAQAHQELPFDALIEHLRPPRSPDHDPLVQTFFSVEYDAPPPPMPGLEVDVVPVPNGTVKFDLSLVVHPAGRGAAPQGRFDCRTDLFERPSIERLAREYLGLLAAATASPDEPIGLQA